MSNGRRELGIAAVVAASALFGAVLGWTVNELLEASDRTAFIALPGDPPGDDAEVHVQAACASLSRADWREAAAEAALARRLDDRWTLFHLAVIDSQDGVQDWFDVGHDEQVMNLTCSGVPRETSELEVPLKKSLP